MHTRRLLAVILIVFGTVCIPGTVFAIPIVPDDFEDGTTQGWLANLLNMGGHPAPPANVATGGPSGAGDNYLQVTALGGAGNGSRLTVINGSQWAGDYLAAGVTAVSLSAINLGSTDLFLRLVFEDPTIGPPTNIAYSADALFLPAGGGWMTLMFPVQPGFLTAGLGDVETALQNTTIIRLYHSQDDNFPNPISPIDPVVAQLGVDNIAAVTAIPEPATIWLLTVGIGAFAARRRGNSSI